MFLPVRINQDPTSQSQLIHFENFIRQSSEKTVYVTDCTKYDRHGLKPRDRAIIITTKNLYFMHPGGKGQFEKKGTYSLEAIEKITVSSNKDSILIVSLITPAHGSKPERKDDYVFLLPNLIEFVTKLMWMIELERREVLDIIPSGRRPLQVGSENGCFVDFGVGQSDNILGTKKILIVQSKA